MKTILSLFDYSGNWPKYYRENGYNVYSLDIKNGVDILELSKQDIESLGPIYGIMAAPPCTDFAGSGAQYWKAKDADGRTEASLRLIDKTLDIINWCDPFFWGLENPVGRLPTLRPAIGRPWYFNPNEYAGWLHGEASDKECYTKRTGIWGNFNKPEKSHREVIKGCNPIMSLGGKSERTKELRSMTPLGFSYAFYLANQ